MKNQSLAITFLFLPFLCALMSCSDDDQAISTVPAENYLPLTVGNYWVYEHFEIDSLGVEHSLNVFDSVAIDKDTIIEGETYARIGGSITFLGSDSGWEVGSVLRDSSQYLVNQNGERFFSATNFVDTLNREFIDQGIYSLQGAYKMERANGTVVVPAGTFDNALNYKGKIFFEVRPDSSMRTVCDNALYVDGVGKVLDTYYNIFMPGQRIFEKRLVRYNVQ